VRSSVRIPLCYTAHPKKYTPAATGSHSHHGYGVGEVGACGALLPWGEAGRRSTAKGADA
jgi:hypothetical protein